MMEKIRRNERMSAMLKMLAGAPNRIFTLSSFCDLFGAAKSTMSEDVDALQAVLQAFDLGQVETVTGAAGGVRRCRHRAGRADRCGDAGDDPGGVSAPGAGRRDARRL